MNSNIPRATTRIASLISFFLSKNPGAGRTQIVNFLYLTDLEYRQYQGKQVTDLEYIWGAYGPFDQRIYDVLDLMQYQGQIRVNSYRNPNGSPAFRYELATEC